MSNISQKFHTFHLHKEFDKVLIKQWNFSAAPSTNPICTFFPALIGKPDASTGSQKTLREIIRWI